MEPLFKKPRTDNFEDILVPEVDMAESHSFEMVDFKIETYNDCAMYCCKFCPKKFQFFISLSCHMHMEHNLNRKPFKKLNCEICEKTFKDDVTKMNHMNTKHFSQSGENILKNNTGIQAKPNFLLKIRVKNDAPLVFGTASAM